MTGESAPGRKALPLCEPETVEAAPRSGATFSLEPQDSRPLSWEEREFEDLFGHLDATEQARIKQQARNDQYRALNYMLHVVDGRERGRARPQYCAIGSGIRQDADQEKPDRKSAAPPSRICACGHDEGDHRYLRVTDGSGFDRFRYCDVPGCTCRAEELR